MLGIIGLIIAVSVIIYLICKNWHMAVVSLIGALIVILFNGMSPMSALSENFMVGMKDFAGNWFLLFMFGSIFGKVMGDSGASVGIANHLFKLFGDKSAILVVMIAGLVLSYGGIGTFIIAFSVYPLAVALFQKADISKKLICAVVLCVPITVCMVMLPGSPSNQNIMPTTYFGTTIFAAPTIGIICSILQFIGAYLYFNWQVKKYKANGVHFEAGVGENIINLDEADKGNTPETWKCYAPIFVLLVVLFAFQFLTSIAAIYAVAIAMALAILLGSFLYNDKFEFKTVINEGTVGGLSALFATSAIMGFGSTASASPAYAAVSNALMNLDLGPLATAIISINVIAAITGSSAGGLNIFLSSMGEYLAATGINLEVLHRVVCIASAGLDSMPHASGFVICNQIAKTSPRDTYRHLFVTCALMPLCCAIFAAILGTVGIV